MTDTPINLRAARKAQMRAKKGAQADENAMKFGRTKAQKALEQAQAEQAAKTLDAHKRTP